MSSAQIRLTEPQVFLVGSLEYERARARQRRATAREAAAANRPPSGETPPPSPGPSSRRNSPERERSVFHISASRAGSRSRPGSRAASPAARGRLGQITGNGTNNEEFIPPNSRGRSASRSRGPSVSRGRAESESLSVGRSGSLVRDSEHQVNANTPAPPMTETLSRLDEPPPALLRGLLTVTLSKPTRVKEILVRLKGTVKTDWPEGIGPRRLDVVEENILINVTHKFFSASDSTTARRAASVGPTSNRDESRGRAPARRAASVAPGRDASHGRSYPNNSLFPNGLDNPPLSHSASDSTHAPTGLSRISSNDSHETSVPPRSSSIPPVRPGEAAPAYEAVPSAPPSPLQLPQTIEEMSTSESLDLSNPSSSSLRPNPPAASYRLGRSPTPTRSPLGMSTSMLPESSSSTSLNNGQTNRMPRLARSSTRASQNSESSTSSSHTSHSNEVHHSSSSIHSSSGASENGRGRATTRNESRESAGSDPAGDLSVVANGVARHSRTSLHSRPSPSPSGTTSPRSPSTPRLPSALKTSKSSSRSGSRARFSLSGISEALRGKSSSRARAPAEEEQIRPPIPSRRDSSPDISTSRPSSIKGSGGGRSQSRGRKTALKVLREALTTGHAHLNEQEGGSFGGGGTKNEDHAAEASTGDGWKEFKAGTYVYPISIPVPGILPPTLTCEFGSVSYTLKATVVRAGALTTNLTAHSEVMLVAMPGEDDTEESESIVVERFWETQMKYHVALSGKSFPIGGQIPLTIRLSPLAKVKVFRVSAQLEQKTSYFASVHSGRKLTRHETPRKVMLIRVDNKDPDEQMLPILSEDQNALLDHPLREWFINATSSDDTTPSLLDPDGPWHLEHNLQLPDCSSKINFSTHHEKANMAISHVLKIMIRVERGDDEFLDSKGKRKRWDIVVETPVHLLSCRCAQNLLPAYTASSATLSAGPSGSTSGSSSIITRAIRTATGTSTPHEHTCGVPQPSTTGLRSTGIGATVHRAAASNHHPTPVASLEQNLLFARLISGETTPNGETPPTYQEISQGDVREVNGNAERGRSRGRSSTIVVVDDEELEDGRGRSSSTRRG
ncbi:hypothetical protein JCM5353_007979 [Sporobolomyces roseus]